MAPFNKESSLIFPTQKTDPQGFEIIHKSTGDFILYDGAVRSRKTITSLFAWLLFVTENPKGNGLYMFVGKTLDTLKANILIPLSDFLPPYVFSYSIGKREAYLNVDGKTTIIIYLVGGVNEESTSRIQGRTLFTAIADEATTYPTTFLKMLLSRFTANGAKCFLTMNPDTPTNYIFTDLISRRHEENLNISYFHFTLDSNPFLLESKKEQLKSLYTGLWYQRFILGHWVAAEGAVYTSFSDENIYNEEINVDSYIIAIDYGTKNPTVFLKMVKNGTTIYVIDEYYFDPKIKLSQLTTNEQVNNLVKFNNGQKPRAIIIDPSATYFIIDVKKQYGMSVKKANNKVLEGIQYTDNLFYQKQLLIHQRCTNLIKELRSYVWDEKSVDEKPKKINDHAVDALRYGVMYFNQIKGVKAKHGTI